MIRHIPSPRNTTTMLILSEADVRTCFSVRAALAINRKALSSLRTNGDGGAVVPTRIGLPYNHGESTGSTDWSLFKPAAYSPLGSKEDVMGIKVVSIRANNPSNYGKPTVPATVVLLHPETGEVSAIVGSTYLTAARTAAGSALATELALGDGLGRCMSLVVFGAGLQAELHVQSIRCVVKLKEVVIINRSWERANRLKEELLRENDGSTMESPLNISTVLLSDGEGVRNAVRIADIIVTATNTSVPLFSGEWVKPGCHINGVGSYTPLMKEVEESLVHRCEVLMDTEEARDVGDLSCLKQDASNCVGLIGDVLVGNVVFGARRDDPYDHVDCTFFKSVGTAIQDVLSAQHVVDVALENGIGATVEM